jgi:hypothetical protein
MERFALRPSTGVSSDSAMPTLGVGYQKKTSRPFYNMSGTSYCVDICKRKGTCIECKKPIEEGALRIGRSTVVMGIQSSTLYFHPSCVKVEEVCLPHLK